MDIKSTEAWVWVNEDGNMLLGTLCGEAKMCWEAKDMWPEAPFMFSKVIKVKVEPIS